MLMLRDILRIVFGWSPQSTLHETAWLDGVRGIAAFLVMLNHFDMEWLSQFSDAPFGAVVLVDRNPDGVWYHRAGDRLWAPWRLPILRILMVSGGAQVAVFFVLSGLVLSWSPIGSIQAENYEKLYQSLGSSTIRRWFRLYLPCAIVSTTYMAQRVVADYKGVVPTLGTIWDYLVVTEKWANPFETVHITQFSTNHAYNFVMWTIPFEFSGSIFVYVSLLGLGRVQSFYRRFIAIILVSLYALSSLQWGYWLFGFGIALADYVRYSGGFRKLSQKATFKSNLLWSFTLALGLVLMGYINHTEWYSRPGYEWTEIVPLPDGWRTLIGEERFWWGWGGILVVTSCCHLSIARKFFELAFVQHLGRISFMLYLIHFLINVIISQPIRRILYQRFATKEFDEAYNGDVFRTSPFFNIAVHLTLWTVSITIVMIVAHVLEVLVDRPCTAFGKWLDNKLMNGLGEKEIKKKEVINEEEEQLLESPDVYELELGQMQRP